MSDSRDNPSLRVDVGSGSYVAGVDFDAAEPARRRGQREADTLAVCISRLGGRGASAVCSMRGNFAGEATTSPLRNVLSRDALVLTAGARLR